MSRQDWIKTTYVHDELLDQHCNKHDITFGWNMCCLKCYDELERELLGLSNINIINLTKENEQLKLENELMKKQVEEVKQLVVDKLEKYNQYCEHVIKYGDSEKKLLNILERMNKR